MHSWMAVYIPYSTGLRSGLLGGLMSGVKSRVLCHSSLVLLCTRALESKSRQQLDKCLAATVWAARHHSNMHHSLSPLAAWKPHQCSSAWKHRLKPTRINMFIRKQWATSMSWSNIWLKPGQQPCRRASSINQVICGKIVLMRVSKPKANTAHLL